MIRITHLHPYPSVYALGHAAVADILDGPVLVEEKIDGSQFGFGNLDGELCCRSKGAQLVPDAPEKMFEAAIATAREVFPLLRPGWTYRAEYLRTSKHNTLAYGRVPLKHLAIFDINSGLEEYLSPEEKALEASRLGLETVPCFGQQMIDSLDALHALLGRESCLGGTTVEGVVLKRYDRFTKDKKAMMAKFVSESFKERHQGEWKKANPSTGDLIQTLVATLRTDARWEKAIQHLRDDGRLEGSPCDIGSLIKEVAADILKEEREAIAEQLFRYAWPKIQRGVTAGLAEWYKERLAAQAMPPKEAP